MLSTVYPFRVPNLHTQEGIMAKKRKKAKTKAKSAKKMTGKKTKKRKTKKKGLLAKMGL